MASPSTTARSRAPQALDAEDRMAMRAAELAAWARRNVQTILVATGVVLAVALVAFFFWWNQQRTAARAAAQWMQVQEAMGEGPAGIPRLSSFANTFASTPEGAEARLALAGLYLQQNQPQQAVEEARRVAERRGPLAFQGRMLLAAAQAQAGQRDEAIRSYQQAAQQAELVFQRQEARSAAALLHEAGGNWRGAAELYRGMLADTREGTMDRSVIELRLAEAEARAAAGS